MKATGTAAILVTHHQDEAFALADRIGVMHGGAIAQWDTAYQLYLEPTNSYVADFVGEGVLLPGTMEAPDRVSSPLGEIIGNRMYAIPEGAAVDLRVRPDDIQPDPAGPLECTVAHRNFRGSEILYTLALEDQTRVLSLFPSHMDYLVGE